MQEKTSKPNKLYSFISRIIPASKKDIRALFNELSENRQMLEGQIERLDNNWEESYKLRLEDRAVYDEISERCNTIYNEITTLKENSEKIYNTLKLYQESNNNLFSELKSGFESSCLNLKELQTCINDMAEKQKIKIGRAHV